MAKGGKKVFNLLFTPCTPTVKMKLHSMKNWSAHKGNQNGLELAKLIRDVLHQKDEKEQSVLKNVIVDKALFLCFQKSHQTMSEYLKAFKARINVCKSTGR